VPRTWDRDQSGRGEDADGRLCHDGIGLQSVGRVRFKGGEILERNFDTYELPRFSSLPRIEAILVKNDELSPQGGGEPAIVPVGAAIANAIFDATGARLFQLPMTPARVKQAIGQGLT